MIDIQVIHPDFRLNGKSYSKETLIVFANECCTSKEEYLNDLGNLILQWFNDSVYVVMHTSGTTGSPKEIHLAKEAMLHSAQATASFFNMGAGSKALLCMSTKFVGGKLMLIRALTCGWNLDVVKPSAKPLEGNTGYYDFVAMVPMQVEHSIAELSNVNTLIIGGAKVNSTLANQLVGISTKVYETYGMTETITHIAAKQIGERLFSVLPHASVSVDTRGCLVIYAPSVNPEAIVTNDLVEVIDANSFEWLGRIDNVINSGGVKLFPEQIESKLSDAISHRFFVIGKEDAYFGSKVVLVIESSPYELDSKVFDCLSKFERPKEIQFVAKFIETDSGKVIRNKSYN